MKYTHNIMKCNLAKLICLTYWLCLHGRLVQPEPLADETMSQFCFCKSSACNILRKMWLILCFEVFLI